MLKHILLFLFCFGTAFAQWSTDISENNIVSWYTLNPIITTDMENGIIVVAQTHPVDPIIYAQRMSVHGERLWPGREGVRVSSSPHEQWLVNFHSPEYEFVMSDGKGGCYIVFQIAKHIGYTELDPDDRYDYNLYLQRLDPQGNRLFGDEGLELMHEEIDSVDYVQEMNYWCPDGEGGIYLIWFRYNKKDVENSGQYMCRISDMGKFIWGPNRIHPSNNYYFIPYLDSNENVNLYYDPGTSKFGEDKFIKINSKTGVVIGEKEIDIGAGEHGFRNAFFDYFFSDNFSAIFVFRDLKADTLRAQKLDENGNKLWGDNPVFIATGLARSESFDAESDKSGGAYVLYESFDDSLHLIHIDRDGTKDWCYSYPRTNWWLYRPNENMSVGGDGSVFLIKEKGKYLTKLNITGQFLWETQVTSRDTVASEFTSYGLLADNLGGCIVLWMESGTRFYGLRAQRINSDGNLGDVTSVHRILKKDNAKPLTIDGLYPNPSNNQVTIKLRLRKPEHVDLRIYNLLGKEVINLNDSVLTQGQHTIVWDGLDQNRQSVSSGIYLFVCQTSTQTITSKFLLLQ